MQAQGRISQASGKHPFKGTAKGGRFAGNKHVQKNEGGSGKPKNNFLKQIFRPILATRLNPLFNRRSYDFLHQSAGNYSKLSGSSFDLLPDGKDFAGLFRYFESLLPGGQHLLLTEENG